MNLNYFIMNSENPIQLLTTIENFNHISYLEQMNLI